MQASVWLYGRHVGDLFEDSDGPFGFVYSPEWLPRVQTPAVGLSLSLPPREVPYGHAEASHFFEGLLPDSPSARSALAVHFGIAADDALSLLLRIGKDCQGAVAIEPFGCEPDSMARSEVELPESVLAQAIAGLSRHPLFVNVADGVSSTLAGFQSKAAVIAYRHRLALPVGGAASTHILKADIEGLPDSTRVEHFCLQTAMAIGINTVISSINLVAGIPHLMVNRYDRPVVGGERRDRSIGTIRRTSRRRSDIRRRPNTRGTAAQAGKSVSNSWSERTARGTHAVTSCRGPASSS